VLNKAFEKRRCRDGKKQEEEKKKEDLPKSGGISPENAALLAMGAGALLVGGRLLVRRVVR
jgi:uncharacterized surface anchored protein